MRLTIGSQFLQLGAGVVFGYLVEIANLERKHVVVDVELVVDDAGVAVVLQLHLGVMEKEIGKD